MLTADALIRLVTEGTAGDLDLADDRTVTALARHQLLGKAEEIGCSHPVLEKALAPARERLDAQLKGLREVARLSSFHGDRPPVVIKGIGTFISKLTGTRRYGADIDMIVDSPAEFAAEIKGLGYQPCTFSNDPEGEESHEELWGYEFISDGVVLDLRATFPVASYAAGPCAETDPRANSGLWRKTSNLRFGRLTHSDVLAHSAEVALGDDCEVFTPLPHMAALILCLDLFKDYVDMRLPPPVAGARLGALNETRELFRRPDFDADAFTELVSALGAADAVAFTDRLLAAFFGEPASAGTSASGDRFPRDLWWDGFIVDPEEELSNLVLRTSGMAERVAHLGHNTVRPGIGYSALADNELTRLGRLLYRADTGAPLGFDLDVAADPNGSLELTVTVHGRPADHLDILFVDLGDIAFEVSRDRETGSTTVEDYAIRPVGDTRITAVFSGEGDGTRFTVGIPREIVRGGSGAGGLPMILGVRRHNDDGNRADASTAAPLVIGPIGDGGSVHAPA